MTGSELTKSEMIDMKYMAAIGIEPEKTDAEIKPREKIPHKEGKKCPGEDGVS